MGTRRPAGEQDGGAVVAGGPTVRRVLMTADAVGGVWRYSLDLGRALAARGIRTTLAVMGPPPDDGQRRDAERAGLSLVSRPYRLEWMDDPWDDVDRAGSWLLALARQLGPDVVHLNGYSHAALPWTVPAVIVAHSCVRSWWRAVKGEEAPCRFAEYRRRVAAGLAAAARIVAPSAGMGAALHEEYGVDRPVQVIPNGITAWTCAPRATKEPFVLAAGRAWDEAKNIGALADIAASVPWPVWVAGDLRRPCGEQDEKLHGIRALGRLPAAQVAEWQQRAAIFALPARYEPFGLSVLEAAAAECALVLGDIPTLRENWEGAAVFVAPGDRQELAAALAGLIEDDARRATLGRLAAARAAAFTLDRMADAYVAAYEVPIG